MQTDGSSQRPYQHREKPTLSVGIAFSCLPRRDYSAGILLFINSLGLSLHDLLSHQFSLEVINHSTPAEIRNHHGEHFLPRHGVEVPRA
jgi:hypothetical protein